MVEKTLLRCEICGGFYAESTKGNRSYMKRTLKQRNHEKLSEKASANCFRFLPSERRSL